MALHLHSLPEIVCNRTKTFNENKYKLLREIKLSSKVKLAARKVSIQKSVHATKKETGYFYFREAILSGMNLSKQRYFLCIPVF